MALESILFKKQSVSDGKEKTMGQVQKDIASESDLSKYQKELELLVQGPGEGPWGA